MNSVHELSPFLKALVNNNTLRPEFAQQLNRLPSQKLQQQAVMELPAVISRSINELCERLLHPERKVLYDSRSAGPESAASTEDRLREAVGEELLDAWIPNLGRVSILIKEKLRSGWRKARLQRLVKWGLVLGLVYFLWGPVLRGIQTSYGWAMGLWKGAGAKPVAAEKVTLQLPPLASPLPVVSREKPSSAPPARTALPPPSEVHVRVYTPDLIRLTWRAVSKDARYNVYSSGSRTLNALRQENEKPLKSNAADWTPETGLERYWIVVTTLDPEGRESGYSEAVEVVRHPEKSGPGAADEAAGVLRKVLPW